MKRFILPLSILSLLSACGEGDPHVDREAGSTPPGVMGGPSAKAGPRRGAPVQTSLERPAAPSRNFNSRFVPYGPWYTELLSRINPSREGRSWPTEIMAGLARRELRGGLRSALSGSAPPLASVIGAGFRALTALRPDETELVKEDGISVLRGEPAALDGGDVRSGDAGALLADLLAPYLATPGDADVELWVTGSWKDAEDFYTRCSVRVSASTIQTNIGLLARWRIREGRARLLTLEGESFEEVSFGGGGFSDITEQTLRGMSYPGSWLWRGALECSQATDNLVIFTDVYLGMHGLGIGDLDGDGLEDVYVARHGGEPNLLLRHKPDGTVEDVGPQAGVDFLDDTTGVLIVDLDGDGWRDLVLGSGSAVVVAWNDGAGCFIEVTRLTRGAGDLDKVYSLSAADADGDGDLDLYDTRYFSGNVQAGGGVPTPYHDASNGARNSLWRNDGQRVLIEATNAFGLDEENSRFSLASLWEDLDGDGDLDLYVVNDFGKNNLYLRGPDGQYSDTAGSHGVSDMAAGMGITCADANGDGVLDLYVTNMFSAAGRRVTGSPQFAGGRGVHAAEYQRHSRGNSLLLGRGDGRFLDGTRAGGTGPGGWAWGAMFADFDSDTRPDLYVPNGFLSGRDNRDLQGFFWREVVNASPLKHPPDQPYLNAWKAITRLSQDGGYSWSGNERNYLYMNLGGASFVDATRASGGGVRDDTRVGATCDWDGDGRVDLWLKNRTAPVVRLLSNRIEGSGNWVSFELVGLAPNSEAIGALVALESGGQIQPRRVYAGEGYLGNPSKRLHFGLGGVDVVERLTITWPGGEQVLYEGLEGNRRYRITMNGSVEDLGSSPPAGGARRSAGVPTSGGSGGSRTVALERFPYAPLPLPRFDGSPEELSDHAGRPVLLYVWGSWDDPACAGLTALGERQAEFSAAGIDVCPVSLDGVRGEEYARGVVSRSGLVSQGGRASLRERVLIELACQAVLANYEDLDLPVSMLFDTAGRLCVIWSGQLDIDAVLDDGQRLLSASEERTTTLSLTGGRWLTRPTRYLDKAAERLETERGERAMADELRRFVGER